MSVDSVGGGAPTASDLVEGLLSLGNNFPAAAEEDGVSSRSPSPVLMFVIAPSTQKSERVNDAPSTDPHDDEFFQRNNDHDAFAISLAKHSSFPSPLPSPTWGGVCNGDASSPLNDRDDKGMGSTFLTLQGRYRFSEDQENMMFHSLRKGFGPHKLAEHILFQGVGERVISLRMKEMQAWADPATKSGKRTRREGGSAAGTARQVVDSKTTVFLDHEKTVCGHVIAFDLTGDKNPEDDACISFKVKVTKVPEDNESGWQLSDTVLMDYKHLRANMVTFAIPEDNFTRQPQLQGRKSSVSWTPVETQACKDGMSMFGHLSDCHMATFAYFYEDFEANRRTSNDIKDKMKSMSKPGYDSRREKRKLFEMVRRVYQGEAEIHHFGRANCKPKWTKAEDEALKKGLMEFPPSNTQRWLNIRVHYHDIFLPCRDPNEIRSRAATFDS